MLILMPMQLVSNLLYRHFIVGVTFKGWRNMLQKNKKYIDTHGYVYYTYIIR